MDINNFTLIGRLARDPEYKHVGESQLAMFSLAFSTGYGDKKKSNFIDCKAWGKLADIVKQYTKKGSQICINGNLEQETWDGQDGKKNSKIVVKVVNIQLLGSKQEGQNQNISQPEIPDPEDVF